MKLISQAVLILAVLAIVVAGAFLLLRDLPSAGGFEIMLPTAVPPATAGRAEGLRKRSR